ncbi:MAG: Na+/H+ antiporter subunit E [Dokdonella sp.]|uniref:Na+/H+ antiporter subunit E n=1 Tax=Dokdonella sp. TaxID=2291710 RepID=UPI003BAF8083
MKALFAALLPSPGLSMVVLVLWLVLARTPSLAQALVGVFLAFTVPHIVATLRAPRAQLRNPRGALRFLATVVRDVVASNFEIAWGLLRRGSRQPTAGFVVIPLQLRDPVGLAVLAMVTTIVPGTVWSELAIDRSAMLLHVWDVPDKVAFVARFKARYEQPLCEIFE